MNSKMFLAVYHRTAPLTRIEFAFLATLAGASEENDKVSSPSIKQISERSGLSKGAIAKASKSLQGKGILEIQKRRTAKGHLGNCYIVHAEKLGRELPVDESEPAVNSEDFQFKGILQASVTPCP